jgi:peptidoglycan/LPS O-acetylase OafA/YrhL
LEKIIRFTKLNYRAEIDGLRAIGVISVVLYHAQIVIFGRDWFEGGFIGVDIFFIISGYLITRIILTELEETNKFSFIKFYERRARRILPMLFLVIAVCIPFAWQKLLPLDLIDFAKSALSAIGFGSNFYFYYSTTEYGAHSALLKPLLHTWSLGVEEQFYIVVPVIILLIWKFARTSLLTVFVGMLLLSIMFSDVMEGRNSELNFFLPFSRFWELFVGSALAFVELKYGRFKNSLATQTLPILGLFLIVNSILFFDSNTPHPSFQTLIPIVGVALVLAFCSTNDLVRKLLSIKPMVGVGRISYSLYLWHFPLFAFIRYNPAPASMYEKVGWMLIIIVLSIVSYFLIEKPIRKRQVIKPKLFYSVVILTASALVYLSHNFIVNDGYKSRLPPILAKNNLNEEVWKHFRQDEKQCHNRKSNFCRLNNGKELTRVYAFGDSHFSAISPKLVTALGKNFNYTEANLGGCPFVLNTDQYITEGKKLDHCSSEFQSLRYENIEQKPSIVLIGGRFPLYLSSYYFDNKEGGVEAEYKYVEIRSINGSTFEKEIQETINSLISNGHQVVLIYPIPEVGVSVPNYLQKEFHRNIFGDNKTYFKLLTTSYQVYKERSKSSFEVFGSIQSPNIHRVYPHTVFCDKQIKDRCVTHNNEDTFYADNNHPSAKGSEMIVELIMKQIEKAEENIRQKY